MTERRCRCGHAEREHAIQPHETRDAAWVYPCLHYGCGCNDYTPWQLRRYVASFLGRLRGVTSNMPWAHRTVTIGETPAIAQARLFHRYDIVRDVRLQPACSCSLMDGEHVVAECVLPEGHNGAHTDGPRVWTRRQRLGEGDES